MSVSLSLYTESPRTACFHRRRADCARRNNLSEIAPADCPPPMLTPSPLHDAAEVGDVELITKLLAKESNDGDFNPVRLEDVAD